MVLKLVSGCYDMLCIRLYKFFGFHVVEPIWAGPNGQGPFVPFHVGPGPDPGPAQLSLRSCAETDPETDLTFQAGKLCDIWY